MLRQCAMMASALSFARIPRKQVRSRIVFGLVAVFVAAVVVVVVVVVVGRCLCIDKFGFPSPASVLRFWSATPSSASRPSRVSH